MPNPIADPLVEGVDNDVSNGQVRIEATRAGAATVWIDRPARRNAFDSLTVAALHEAFETLKGAEGVRIVFLRGVGGQFGDGADLDWVRLSADLNEDDHRRDALAVARMLKTLSEIPALTVALVEGAAIGAAAGLAAACDMAVASADARFGFPAVRLGQLPAPVAPYLIEAVGPRAARALLALGQTFDAAHAEKIGLVGQVVADAAALDAAQAALALDILACAPGAMAEAKAWVRHVAGRAVDHDLMEEAARHAARVRASDEGCEGVAALADGGKPAWTAI
jgi:methylglutaconyl-CoA hydratase